MDGARYRRAGGFGWLLAASRLRMPDSLSRTANPPGKPPEALVP